MYGTWATVAVMYQLLQFRLVCSKHPTPLVADVALLVYCKCQSSRSNPPLASIHQLHPTQPTLDPSTTREQHTYPRLTPLSSTYQQLKPSRTLAPTQPVPFPPVSTLTGYPLPHGPGFEKEKENYNYWHYPGPLREGRLFLLKHKLKKTFDR